MLLLLSGFFNFFFFFTKFFQDTIRVSNGSDPDQDQLPVGRHLGSNCLRGQVTKFECAYREDSNKSANQNSLIRFLVFRLKKLWTYRTSIED